MFLNVFRLFPTCSKSSKAFWHLEGILYNRLIFWISDSDSLYLTLYGYYIDILVVHLIHLLHVVHVVHVSHVIHVATPPPPLACATGGGSSWHHLRTVRRSCAPRYLIEMVDRFELIESSWSIRIYSNWSIRTDSNMKSYTILIYKIQNIQIYKIYSIYII